MRAIKTTLISAIAIGLLAGSAVGVLAQARTEDPVAFTGHIASGSSILQEGAGSAWVFSDVEMSDPRLTGTVTHSHNIDSVGGFKVFSSVWRIENEEGPEHTVIIPGETRTRSSVVLTGEGGYEGLSALAEFMFVGFDKDVRGVIIDGDLPPLPPPACVAE